VNGHRAITAADFAAPWDEVAGVTSLAAVFHPLQFMSF